MARAKKKLPTGPINIITPNRQSLEKQENRKQETSEIESIQPESVKQENRKQEDYKKVAMRLSVRSVQKLRSLKNDTGLPYEVIVDMLIQQWDSLDLEFQRVVLAAAGEERIRRLVAGQQKATQTTMNKLQNL